MVELPNLKGALEDVIRPVISKHYTRLRDVIEERNMFYRRYASAYQAVQKYAADNNPHLRIEGASPETQRELTQHLISLEEAAKQSLIDIEKEKKDIPPIDATLIVTGEEGRSVAWTMFNNTESAGVDSATENVRPILSILYSAFCTAVKEIAPYAKPQLVDGFYRFDITGGPETSRQLETSLNGMTSHAMRIRFKVLSLGDLLGTSLALPPDYETLQSIPSDASRMVGAATLQPAQDDTLQLASVRFGILPTRSCKYNLVHIPKPFRAFFPAYRDLFILEINGTTFQDAYISSDDGKSDPALKGQYIYAKAVKDSPRMGTVLTNMGFDPLQTTDRLVQVELISPPDPAQGIRAVYRLTLPTSETRPPQ